MIVSTSINVINVLKVSRFYLGAYGWTRGDTFIGQIASWYRKHEAGTCEILKTDNMEA